MDIHRMAVLAVLGLVLVPSLAWATPVQMPEPSSTMLVGLGLGALALRKLRQPR
jgi:hypothetical protein